jgi:hypothetical protein
MEPVLGWVHHEQMSERISSGKRCQVFYDQAISRLEGIATGLTRAEVRFHIHSAQPGMLGD